MESLQIQLFGLLGLVVIFVIVSFIYWMKYMNAYNALQSSILTTSEQVKLIEAKLDSMKADFNNKIVTITKYLR